MPRRGELWYGDRLLKRLPFRTRNTAYLLIVFEEYNWTPEYIDDPLPGSGDGRTRARRLRETVRHLNRDLHSIRFEAAPGGRTLRWLRI
jgi:hypothetical protein